MIKMVPQVKVNIVKGTNCAYGICTTGVPAEVWIEERNWAVPKA
jgi:hypothetical protein